ncbi:formylglycine-generating enzyme required for sulfatase activity [Pseudodesulfovibrio indicus]|uniref:Formylglycine-generating enzyme required for sulfatase activity n=2 Tax=Pseudodesulfovibrio indicus TaxID=1716143 RepID=A0A126QLG3_9BACT|nr:hypothetical protein AWY79_07165 [Pseudodesulfovibrio indicus]TDT91895.1 formylglycine-generating enzyme required for sulfatase activity [Pseudodesulfovibrio indicus]
MLRAKTVDWVVRAVFLLAALAVCQPAHAAKRVALVIGNGGYASSPLNNPVNDAKDMADKLRGLGFEVTLLTDAGQRKMEDAIHAFDARLGGANVRLFYYAGHGMQVQGANYLIPVDAEVRAERDIKYEAVNAGRVLDGMADAGPGVNILILDACRNNPFARSFRSGSRGLARMDAPSGSMIVYATSPGDVAADGSGRNGIFTKHLLAYVDQSGLTLEQVFKRTGRDVMRETKGDQVPWTASSVFDEVYLSGKTTAAGVSMPDTQPQVDMARVPEGQPQAVAEPSVGDTWSDPTTGMEFVFVPGGCFQMGSSSGVDYEKPVHEVCVDGFWMGKYEVTQTEWQRVMKNNPAHFKGERNPVEQVSWNDVQDYIKRLNAKGNGTFRLPTEAEWEYAARSGGRDEKYAGGNNVDHVAWYRDTSNGKTHPVGTKAPNGLGLYDMSGNVWEWCQDVYDQNAYSRHSHQNPVYSGKTGYYVERGGGWGGMAWDVRAANRAKSVPSSRNSYRGFRLLRTN